MTVRYSPIFRCWFNLVKLVILFPYKKKGLKLFSNNKYGRHKISRTENVCLYIVMMLVESKTEAALVNMVTN